MWGGVLKTFRMIVRAFAHDWSLGQAVTYHHLTGLGFDPASQAVSPTYQSVQVRALVGPAQGQPGPGGQAALGQENLVFLVAQSDLSQTPQVGDKISLGSDNYQVAKVTADRARAAYRIEAELK
ncbi:MAG: hypothetical protein JRJ59_12315 [Deltaproteobacteria bacterium]|nr:hypothetical protein [Deltaproteobacteria bacterium]